MPVITAEEFQHIVPQLKGKAGLFLIKRFMHLASVDKVNELYDRNNQYQGADFADAILRDVVIDYSIGNPERLESLPEGPFITVSNHPYGHLDGIMLIDMIGHRRPDYKVTVNQLLAHIRAMSPNFIEVVPQGKGMIAPNANSLAGIRRTLAWLHEGHPVGFFPAGAVSDLHPKTCDILDRPWQEPVLRIIQKAGVPVIPIRFFDRNSLYYYRLGLIDWRLRLLRLCSEVFNKRGREIRLGIGATIPVEEQNACGSLEEYGRLLRDSVYGMPLPTNFVRRSELSILPTPTP